MDVVIRAKVDPESEELSAIQVANIVENALNGPYHQDPYLTTLDEVIGETIARAGVMLQDFEVSVE